MSMKKNLLSTGWLLFLVTIILSPQSFVYAQVYNTGNMYVAPGASVSLWGSFTNTNTGSVDHQGATIYANGDVSNAGSINIASGAVISLLATNWANTGTAIFSGMGKVSFDGTAAQNIDGGYTSGTQPSFSGIIINNASNVNLTNTAASVSNALTFTNGSILLGNNNLRLDATASISGAGAGMLVATNGTGYLIKEGVGNSSFFSFPVGRIAGDYTPCSVANTSGSSRNYTVNVKNYTNSTPDEGSNISTGMDRTWQIFADAAGTANITLVHNAVTNTSGPGTNGATFNNSAAYVTQQVADGNWTTTTTTTSGGTPVNTISSAAAVTLPALSSDFTGFFSKSSDIMSSLSKTIMTTPKVFLQGAYSGGVMTTTLNTLGLIPLTQPYSAGPFNYAGVEKVTAIPANVTDWILVELRDAVTPTTVMATRAAFLLKDGTITDLDGVSPLRFKSAAAGNYFIAVRHRNHLGIRNAASQAFAVEANTTFDFTALQANAYQNGAISSNPAMAAVSGGKFALWAGNASSNNNVKYSGPGNDQTVILNAALGGNPNLILSNVYNNADLNMNGTVRFSGPNNEQNFLLNTILGGNPNFIITQHL